ncbi:hypothetical protein GOBAR_AA09425 [Gossypium barbadense]|uniref:Uncharacterized protein n=1 Tax=Gossypium barbadense TaxID=3634 RepID=A0A2P5Y6J9_GOSBA|nr:hypothetical protein GOBAR_AA09425 [Gossypium barbadense]
MLSYQWEDVVRFWNSKKGEEVKSRQKVGRLHLFEITHRKKDGSPMTFEAGEIMEKLKEKKTKYEVIASTDSSVNLENIDNRIIIEVLGPERYSRNSSNNLERGSRERGSSSSEGGSDSSEGGRGSSNGSRVEQKYDDLQLQLQQMMQMFQQSQKLPS